MSLHLKSTWKRSIVGISPKWPPVFPCAQGHRPVPDRCELKSFYRLLWTGVVLTIGGIADKTRPMFFFKTSILAIFLALCVVVSQGSGRAAAQGKVGVVDFQRAINETEEGRKAKAQLKKVFEQKQTSLDKRQNELKAMKDTLEKQKNVLARDVLQKKFEDYQKSYMELQQTYMEYQKELQQKEGELTKQIVQRMEVILRRIGQAEGYAMIVERNEGGVVWAPTNLDLTDLVIQRYNAGEGKTDMPANAKPAGPAAATPKPAAPVKKK